MSLISGKKRRRKDSRISKIAEAYVPILLDKLAGIHAFDPDGRLIYPVIEELVLSKCTDYRRYHHPHTRKIVESGGEFNGRTVCDALLGQDGISVSTDSRAWRKQIGYFQRWEDTSPIFQAAMILYALKLEGKPHRQLTFHISKHLADEAIRKKQPLQALVQKRLREHVKRLLGDVEFGMWYHIEQVPFKPDKLHAHGLIYLHDGDWFTDNLRRNERLRDTIKIATGYDGRGGKNWLAMRDRTMNVGWIWYSTKGARDRLRTALADSPSVEQAGKRLESRSHSLSRIGKDFYSRIRPFLNATLTNEILDWTDDEWEAVGVTHDLHFSFEV